MPRGLGDDRCLTMEQRAVLGRAFSLCNERNCIGVGQGEREGEVLLSFSNGAIKAFNIEDHSCVDSWQLPSTRKVTTAASFHQPTGRFWAARDESEVVSWRSEDYKSEAYPSTIHCTLTSNDLPCPLVVFRDGRVMMMSHGATDQSDHLRSTRQSRRSQVLLAEIVHHSGGVSVCVVHSVDKCASVSVWRVKGEGVELSSQSRLTMNGGVSVCCVCGEMLVIVDSNGHLSTSSLFHPDRPLTPSCKPLNQPIALQSVSHDYFVLATMEGGMVNLLLWDMTYFACRCRTPVPLSYLHSFHCLDGYVLLCGDSVMVCSVTGVRSEGVLAGALGSGPMQDSPPTLMLSEWRRPESSAAEDTGSHRYISSLTDRDQTPTLKKFTKAFSSRPLTPGLDYGKVVKRLLEETDFWARDIVMAIMDAGLLPQSLCGELLQEAVMREDWVVVKAWLEACPGSTPEVSIVQLLKAIVSLPEEVASYGAELSRGGLLRLVLQQPFTDALMHPPVSQLPFPIVMNLLQFLSGCINVEQFFSSPQDTSCYGYDQLLEWAGLLIDVHFTQLSLHPEATQLLRTIRHSIFRQVQCFNNLSVLLQVGVAKDDKWAGLQGSDWQYKIEKMDVTV